MNGYWTLIIIINIPNLQSDCIKYLCDWITDRTLPPSIPKIRLHPENSCGEGKKIFTDGTPCISGA